MTLTGRCLCGAVRYTTEAHPTDLDRNGRAVVAHSGRTRELSPGRLELSARNGQEELRLDTEWPASM